MSKELKEEQECAEKVSICSNKECCRQPPLTLWKGDILLLQAAAVLLHVSTTVK
jgi:hypothetical protein